MVFSELKLQGRVLAAVISGVIFLCVLAYGTWNYVSMKSDLADAIIAKSDVEKSLQASNTNYELCQSASNKLKEQIDALAERNKGLIDAVTLSKKRVDVIKGTYEKLLQTQTRAPESCSDAMQWMRDQAKRIPK